MRKNKRGIAALMLALVLLVSGVIGVSANTAGGTSLSNKYNVVMVIDESGSMKKTDADHLRYDATKLFLGLMSNEGNYVGTVSFDDEIIYSQDITAVQSREDKDVAQSAIESHTATNGDTDIGGALEKAVAMLDVNADPALPSVIILLTDGNTDLDNNSAVLSEEEEISLEKKAEAIEAARTAGYRVYSVCLNENGKADFSETEQISNATGGLAKEVTQAADLSAVFEMFYELIYGTGSTTVYTGTVPVEASFVVPSVGVEEANITIEGNVTSIVVTGPDGNPYAGVEETKAGNITLEKILQPVAGEWKIAVDGDPNTQIAIKLLYNYGYNVKDASVFKDSYDVGETAQIRAVLTDDNHADLPLEDDGFYSAEIRMVDGADKVIETIPMTIGDNGFNGSVEVTEVDHAYRYYVAVMKKDIASDDKIVKSTPIRQFVSGSNTAPISNGDIEETVKLWPFKKNVYQLDLTALAQDKEDSELTYHVVSSSFVDKADSKDGDFSIEDNKLVQDKFSLRKGSYIIRCVDSGGLYCDVKVKISTLSIGMLTAIGLIIAALIAAGVFLYGLYSALNKRFNGDIYLRVGYEGEELKRSKNRGRMKLNVFNVPLQGLDGNKSYFQALGGRGVELVTNKEIYYGGRPTKRIMISSGGTGTEIKLDESGMNVIYVRFASRVRGGGPRPGASRGSRGAGSRGTGKTAGRTPGAGAPGAGSRTAR